MFIAVRTGLEPATPCVTGMYSNQAELPHHSVISFVAISLSRLRVQSYYKIWNCQIFEEYFQKKVGKFLFSKNKSYI